MMNQRAAILHWIVFGILAALGFFLVQIGLLDTQAPATMGIWQQDFLKIARSAETQLLSEESAARFTLQEAEKEVAKHGGSITKLDCGEFEERKVWNTPTTWCYPDVYKELEASFVEKSQSLPYTAITRSDDYFILRGEPIVQEQQKMWYSLPRHFRISFADFITEIRTITHDAQQVVLICGQESALEKCIEREKKQSWQLCPTTSVLHKMAAFCVKGIVEYQFALDFTSSLLAVEKVSAVMGEENVEITFPLIPEIKEYTIYITDDERLYQQRGKARELFAEVLPERFLDSFKIDGLERCSDNKVAQKGYACGEEVVYLIDKSLLTERSYVTVTAWKDGQESLVKAWGAP